MATDQRPTQEETNAKARNEGFEEGIITGIRYWEQNRAVHSAINRAAARPNLEKKGYPYQPQKDISRIYMNYLKEPPLKNWNDNKNN